MTDLKIVESSEKTEKPLDSKQSRTLPSLRKATINSGGLNET